MRILCSALGVSPSGYYAWRSRGPSARAVSDAALAVEIRRSHARSRGTYGVPRIHADLADAGHHISRKRVARLMRRDGLAGVHRRRFVRTTIRDADAAPYPDLVDRDFSAEGPDRLWVADITQLPTRSGSCYLASIVDAWSRRVVGWSMATHMRAELVTRRPRRGDRPPPAGGRSRPPLRPRVAVHEPGVRTAPARVRRSRRRWARSATATTTRWPRASSPPWRPSSSTARTGRAQARRRPRSSSTSRSSTTRIRRHSSLGNLSPEQFEERYRSSPAAKAV